MNSKDDLKRLVERLKDITGKTQKQLSVEAGYEEDSLTQAISKKEGHQAVIKQLMLAFKAELEDLTKEESVENSALEEDELKKRDETFISEIKRIGAATEDIARRTGFDREFIRKCLDGDLHVSDNLWDAFSSAFDIGYIEFDSSLQEQNLKEDEKPPYATANDRDKYIKLLEQTNSRLEKSNNALQALTKELTMLLKNINKAGK